MTVERGRPAPKAKEAAQSPSQEPTTVFKAKKTVNASMDKVRLGIEDRETNILTFIKDHPGTSTAIIGIIFGIAAKTVTDHQRNLLRKRLITEEEIKVKRTTRLIRKRLEEIVPGFTTKTQTTEKSVKVTRETLLSAMSEYIRSLNIRRNIRAGTLFIQEELRKKYGRSLPYKEISAAIKEHNKNRYRKT